MSGEPRIGDRERDDASARLAEHYALGRLDEEEHGERLDAIWSARTGSDLRQIFEDLPQAAPAVVEVRGRDASGRPRRRTRPPLLAIALGIILLAMATPGPWWVVLIAVVVLAKLTGAWGHHGSCGRMAHPGR